MAARKEVAKVMTARYANQRELAEAVDRWKKRLGIQWGVIAQVVPANEMRLFSGDGELPFGMARANPDTMVADIRILDDPFEAQGCLEYMDHEFLVLHELLHVAVSDLREACLSGNGEDTAARRLAEERFCNLTARGLLAWARGAAQ